jgi:hypothetical protein
MASEFVRARGMIHVRHEHVQRLMMVGELKSKSPVKLVDDVIEHRVKPVIFSHYLIAHFRLHTVVKGC